MFIILFRFLSLNRPTVEQWINNSVHRGLITDTGENKVGILNHNVHGYKYITYLQDVYAASNKRVGVLAF